jgi:hypothetical protein
LSFTTFSRNIWCGFQLGMARRGQIPMLRRAPFGTPTKLNRLLADGTREHRANLPD